MLQNPHAVLGRCRIRSPDSGTREAAQLDNDVSNLNSWSSSEARNLLRRWRASLEGSAEHSSVSSRDQLRLRATNSALFVVGVEVQLHRVAPIMLQVLLALLGDAFGSASRPLIAANAACAPGSSPLMSFQKQTAPTFIHTHPVGCSHSSCQVV
jgi:hypothetical protein